MKVLVPLDGAELLDMAIPAAKRLLSAVPGAELHLLQVLDPRKVHGIAEPELVAPSAASAQGPTITAVGPRVVESHGEALERQHAESYEWLEQVALREFPGEAAFTHAVWAKKPADRIVEAAKEMDADIIVMATHGRTGIAHFVNGSVTEEVIRLSGRPVLVVGPSYTA
ncbi:MAG: universal stress protein [Dehalococcoidia bacterium]|nr:universal stress protein [Dehalococcoidia bacterium]